MRQPSRLRNRRPALGALLALAAAAVLLGARPAPAPGPDLAAEAANKPVEPPPETHAITEPARAAPDGLLAAYEEVGLLALLRAWPEMVEAPGVGMLGGPRAGLSPREWIGFYEGRQAFLRVYTVQEGLGPFYNDSGCGQCHQQPVIGGSGTPENVITIHAPAWTSGDAMGLRKHAAPGFEPERAAGPTAHLRTPPLFGLGLLDAVPESVREALEDPDDKDGNGIRGRRSARRDRSEQRPARFGHKANESDLEHFCAGAMVDEMSLTNTVRRDPHADRDKLADPEVPRAEVLKIVAFVRNLAAPTPLPRDAQATRGAALFDQIGCTGCHKAKLGEVEGAYTDTLLHDLGPGLAGLKDGAAGPRDWRTAPLWGLRHRARLLHDERAGSIEEAVRAHGGEAKGRSDAFFALPEADRRAIVGFLKTL